MNLDFLTRNAIPHASVDEIERLLVAVDHIQINHGMTSYDQSAILDACTRRLIVIDIPACMRWVADGFKMRNPYISPVPYFQDIEQRQGGRL